MAIDPLKLAIQMRTFSSVAEGVAQDEGDAVKIGGDTTAALTVLQDEDTRNLILSNDKSAPLVKEMWNNPAVRPWITGREFGGGYVVSIRQDKDGNDYIFIVSGGDGDSWQREADSDGIPTASGGSSLPNSDGPGQIVWGPDDIDIIDNVFGGSLTTEEKSDGLYLTNNIMDYIENTYVDDTVSPSKTWADFAAFNFIRQIRQERVSDANDWYIPGQTTTNDFGVRISCEQTGELGDVTEGESEMADIFWYIMKSMDSNRDYKNSECYNLRDIPSYHDTFFYADSGIQSFDDYFYWSSTENSTSNAFKLTFNGGLQGTHAKSNTPLVRAARRIIL